MKNDSKTIITNVSWSLAEKILTEIVNSIITIVLARLIFPEHYGLINLVQIFINISAIFVECGLGEALIQNKDCTEEQESTVFYINFFVGILLYFILFFSAPYIARFKGREELTAILRVLALKIPISSVYNIQNSYIKKKMQFKKYFMSSLSGTLFSGVIGIVLAYKGYGVWALVFATLSDQIMDSIILFLTTKWIPKFRISIKKTKNMISFGSKIFLTEFMSRMSIQARSLLIGIKYSTADLAYDSKGVKFPQNITSLTSQALLKVMFPVLANAQDDKEEMKQIARKSIQMCTYFLTPLMIGLLVVSDNAIPIILTDKWIGCIPYIRIYCIVHLISPISAIDIRVIQASNKANTLIKLRTLDICFGLLMIFIATFAFNDAIYLALAVLVGTIFNAIIDMCAVKKILSYGVLGHLFDLLPTIIVGALMGVVVYFLGIVLPAKSIISLVIQVIVGGIIYIGLSFVLKLEPFTASLDYIKSMLKH